MRDADLEDGAWLGREVIIFGICSEGQRTCWPVGQGCKKQRG